uniref:Uncharacterized protein n=1 Tax=Dulem virus 41 TaxID=3145759 RepID=A0AAU8AXZ9_9CAUD
MLLHRKWLQGQKKQNLQLRRYLLTRISNSL